MARSTTPNFTRTDLRDLADRAQAAAESYGATDSERSYANGVEDTIRTLLNDARATPELTAATGGGLI